MTVENDMKKLLPINFEFNVAFAASSGAGKSISMVHMLTETQKQYLIKTEEEN